MDVIIPSSPLRDLDGSAAGADVATMLLTRMTSLSMDNVLVTLGGIAVYALESYPDSLLSQPGKINKAAETGSRREG